MLTFNCDPVKLQNEEYLKAIANGQEIVLTDDEGEDDDEGDEGLEEDNDSSRLTAGDKVGDDDSSSSDEEEDGNSSSSSSSSSESESSSSDDDEEEKEPIKVCVKASEVAKTAKKVAGTAVKTAKKYATKENLEKAKKVANVAVKTAKKYATKENLEKAKKVAKSAGQALGVKASISSAQQSSSGSDLIGASVPSALSEDEAAAQFTRLVNITPDSERRDFGIVKMPVHFDFTASVDELGDNVNKDVSAIDRKVITLIGRRVAQDYLTKQKREVDDETLDRLARTARVAIKSARAVQGVNEFPFDVSVDVAGLFAPVASKRFTTGVLIPGNSVQAYPLAHVPLSTDRKWEDLRKSIGTLASLHPEKVEDGTYIFRAPAHMAGKKEFYFMHANTPLTDYVRENNAKLFKKPLDLESEPVDGQFYKIGARAKEIIHQSLVSQWKNLPVQSTLYARLIRADGNAWHDTSFIGASLSHVSHDVLLSAPKKVALDLDVEMLVYLDTNALNAATGTATTPAL